MQFALRVRPTRRQLFQYVGSSLAGASCSGWLAALAAAQQTPQSRQKSVILLWLNGGPATIDLWDLKPGHENGGPYQAIDTAVAGVRISEHLPKLAARAQSLSLVRSMSTKEGDHGRASFVAHTGVVPQGAIRFPTLGALVGKELGDTSAELPSAVCIAPRRNPDLDAHSAGFLGAEHAPLLIGENSTYNNAAGDPNHILHVANLRIPAHVAAADAAQRVELLAKAGQAFRAAHPGTGTSSHDSSVQRAVRLMQQSASRTFDLADEPDKVRDAYGRSLFGQSCLLARRLVERGVPFVEVTLDGWDTHQDTFERVAALSQSLDGGFAMLLDDLAARGLLENTLIVCMGEFGRTPKINGTTGRDHFPAAWSMALAGGGIRGGEIVGRTSTNGMSVEERPVTIPDLLATICRKVGIDPLKQNLSNVDRPIRIVDKVARPIEELL